MKRRRISMPAIGAILCWISGAAVADPLGTAFTYQGQLKRDGKPVNAACKFKFTLWRLESGGDPIGDPVTVTVPEDEMVNGLFSAKLNVAGEFGPDAFDGSRRWLAVSVCCAPADCTDPLNFSPLIPRQELTPAPYALHAAAGSDGGPLWQLNGSDVYYTDGNVGIGTDTPDTKLTIDAGGSLVRVFNLGESTGEVYISGPAASPGIGGFANNGNRMDIRFTDSGMRLLTSPTSGMPTLGSGITIAEDGNVGIGQSDPAQKLDVAGHLKFSAANPRILGGTGVRSFSIYGNNNASDSRSWMEFWGENPGGTRDGELALAGSKITFRHNSTVASIGTVGMVLDQEGNVGIGDTTPEFPLSFPNSLGDKISLWGNSGDHYGLGIQSNTLQIHTASSGDRIVFGFGSSDSLTETMRIQGNGNVGIGTTEPHALLEIQGTANQVVRLTSFDNNVFSLNPFMRLQRARGTADAPATLLDGDVMGNIGAFGYDGARFRGGASIRFTVDGDPSDNILTPFPGQIEFWTTNFGLTARPDMVINGSGDVGMGTTTPTRKLEVAGDGKFTGGDVSIWSGNKAVTLRQDSNDTILSNKANFVGNGSESNGKLFLNGEGGINLNYGSAGSTGTAGLILNTAGDVGIGTNDPQTRLDIAVGNKRIQFRDDDGQFPVLNLTGSGNAVGVLRMRNALELWPNDAGTVAGTVDVRDESGVQTILMNGANGRISTKVLEITGADLAEKFPVSERTSPGMVMAIDPSHAGQLRMARGSYNRCVAGVVSGANGLSVGVVLGNLPGHLDAPPIAMSGRVYVWADASNGSIQPGDLLTTSATPGHAMKVTDYTKAQGAILGKAMTSLTEDKGLVLVLVTLQ